MITGIVAMLALSAWVFAPMTRDYLIQGAVESDGKPAFWWPAHWREEFLIRRALRDPVSLEIVLCPLADFVQFLCDYTKVKIVIDKAALAEEGVTTDSLVTIHVEQIAVKSALNLTLDELNATAVIKKTAVVITSKRDDARSDRPDPSRRTSHAEQLIQQRIGLPISHWCKGCSFGDLMELFRDWTQVSIVVDRRLTQAGISDNTPVTMDVEDVPIAQALHQTLKNLGADFVVKDEVVYITTTEHAAELRASDRWIEEMSKPWDE